MQPACQSLLARLVHPGLASMLRTGAPRLTSALRAWAAVLGWTCAAAGNSTSRIEPAGIPFAAGSTDIGFGIGALGSLASFRDDEHLWRWRFELQLFAAAKSSPSGGLEVPYQEHYLRFDLPEPDRGLRWIFETRFFRDATQHYYGVGNASPLGPDTPRFHQIDWEFPSASVTLRRDVGSDFFAFATGAAAYSTIDVYPGSLLERDLGAPSGATRTALVGLGEHGLGTLTAGLALDTRDDEISPTRGLFHDLSVRGGGGIGESFGFTGVDLTTRYFVTMVPNTAVFAARLVIDTLFGRPPVYELWRVGGLLPQNAPGGGAGVRGLPIARYAGNIKVFGNAELRFGSLKFGAKSQPFSLGVVAFVDAGFVRAEIDPHPELDGSGLGLKYGTGGGIRLGWGRAFLARMDAAWSPDGVGAYFDAGHTF